MTETQFNDIIGFLFVILSAQCMIIAGVYRSIVVPTIAAVICLVMAVILWWGHLLP